MVSIHGVSNGQFNETPYVMNSAIGILHTLNLNEIRIIPWMKKFNVAGLVSTFRGILLVALDSTN